MSKTDCRTCHWLMNGCQLIEYDLVCHPCSSYRPDQKTLSQENIREIKGKINHFSSQTNRIFRKYNVSTADRSLLHKHIRGIGMLKNLISNQTPTNHERKTQTVPQE